MSEFLLYNTLSREIEPFAPADGRCVRMYTCGPTVYNPAHLGNFRTFLFEDLLRRSLALRGWSVEQVMNLTDVDDKIIKRANERGLTILQVTDPVVDIFHTHREYLRIQPAEHYPRASDYIPQMIALVERLIAKGVAYVAEDKSVYFAIDKFPGSADSRGWTRARSRLARASVRMSTRRRMRRTLRSGSRPRRKTSVSRRRGNRRGGVGDPGGISSARRWRWTYWATRSICMPVAWI